MCRAVDVDGHIHLALVFERHRLSCPWSLSTVLFHSGSRFRVSDIYLGKSPLLCFMFLGCSSIYSALLMSSSMQPDFYSVDSGAIQPDPVAKVTVLFCHC